MNTDGNIDYIIFLVPYFTVLIAFLAFFLGRAIRKWRDARIQHEIEFATEEDRASCAELLAQYSDLLNAEGPNGPNTKAFLRTHRANEPLIELCRRCRELRELIRSGQLKLQPGDEEAALEEAKRLGGNK